jgi:DNA polymerase I-like protein with 3'-5' exonuclease and polymerase domains/uracil-DNA glycosylase
MGYFLSEEEEIAKRTIVRAPKAAKREIRDGAQGCEACTLGSRHGVIASPVMPMWTPRDADILCVGDSPNHNADMQGKPISDTQIKGLRGMIPPREWPRIAWQNVARCYSPTAPSTAESYACAPFLEADVNKLSPAGILGLGTLAYYSLVSDLPPKDATLYTAYGLWFPVKIGGKPYWFLPTFSYDMLMNKDGSAPKYGVDKTPYYPLMKSDIKRFFQEIESKGTPVFHELNPGQVVRVDNLEDAMNFYARMDLSCIGVDIETGNPRGEGAGLRPYNKDSRMLSASLSDGELTMAYAVDHPEQVNDWAMKFTVSALEMADRWVAHNAAFELAWLNWLGGLSLNPARMEDTMAIGRIKYERASTLNLACMSRIELGVNVKGLTNVNASRMQDYSLSEILPYNGLDTKATVRIWKQEYPKLRQIDNYRRLVDAVATTTGMQLMGLPVSGEKTQELKLKWSEKAATARDKASKLYEARQFQLSTATEFQLSNDQHVAKALVDYGKVKLPKGPSGIYKADEATLLEAAPGNPLVAAALDYREAAKLESTYIDPFIRIPELTTTGLIHPCYTVYLVRTYRTSSEDPNIQNIPSRSNKDLRAQVVAPPGHILVAFDYGQIQVRIIGMLSKDAVLCEYIITKHDMHADWRDAMINEWPEYTQHVSRRLGSDDDKSIFKAARNEIKNDFVFASFFGASPDSCAARLQAPQEVLRYLQGNFWKKFSGVRTWQNQRRAEYAETGSSRIVTGQVRHEKLDGNEPINTPVQGAEAMVVLDAANDCAQLARDTGDNYYWPRMEIHDDLTFILPDDNRLGGYIDRIVPILTKCRYSWQILPWTIECKMGYNWADLEEFDVYEGTYHR